MAAPQERVTMPNGEWIEALAKTTNGEAKAAERRGEGGWESVLANEGHMVAPGGEWRSELWSIAVQQFDRAADLLDLEPGVRVRLLEPRRSLTVNFPVQRDSGAVETFTGYRVQHTLTMGPTKGGVRYAPGVSLGECAALSLWMTLKCQLLGGTPGRRRATGLGVVFCIESVLEHLDWDLSGMRVVVQGFGNVGAVVARELVARGAMLIGVSDVTGGVTRASGLDIDELELWVAEHTFLRGFPRGEEVSRPGVLEVPCDILVPAALECQITGENAHRIDCRLVVEAANGPTTPEADSILTDRGIPIVPDAIANAGGVTVSYFDWVQDQQKYSWEADELVERLRKLLRGGVERVFETSARLDVDWRTAAQAVAIERFADAARLRSIYP